jgi:hypothetical protein
MFAGNPALAPRLLLRAVRAIGHRVPFDALSPGAVRLNPRQGALHDFLSLLVAGVDPGGLCLFVERVRICSGADPETP